MVKENGMVMMSEKEYNSMLQEKEWEIKQLEKRCDMLSSAVLKLSAGNRGNTTDVRVPKLDFLAMYDAAVEYMFNHLDEDVNDLYGYDITIHWHGLYCNCCDGATPTTYIIEGLRNLSEEEPEEY